MLHYPTVIIIIYESWVITMVIQYLASPCFNDILKLIQICIFYLHETEISDKMKKLDIFFFLTHRLFIVSWYHVYLFIILLYFMYLFIWLLYSMYHLTSYLHCGKTLKYAPVTSGIQFLATVTVPLYVM